MAHSRLHFLTSVIVKSVHTYVYPPSEIIMKFCTAILTSGTVEGIHRSGSTFGLGLTNTERNLKKRKTNIMQTNWRTEKHKESDTPQHRPKEVVYIETFKRQEERQFCNQLCKKEKTNKRPKPNNNNNSRYYFGKRAKLLQFCSSKQCSDTFKKGKTLYPVSLIHLPFPPHTSFFSDRIFSLIFFQILVAKKQLSEKKGWDHINKHIIYCQE